MARTTNKELLAEMKAKAKEKAKALMTADPNLDPMDAFELAMDLVEAELTTKAKKVSATAVVKTLAEEFYPTVYKCYHDSALYVKRKEPTKVTLDGKELISMDNLDTNKRFNGEYKELTRTLLKADPSRFVLPVVDADGNKVLDDNGTALIDWVRSLKAMEDFMTTVLRVAKTYGGSLYTWLDISTINMAYELATIKETKKGKK